MNGTATDFEPEVWVGCLACYNNGRLVGKWTDAFDAGELSVQEVHEESEIVEPDGEWSAHEELWVFDHQGFAGALKGECSPSEAQEVAEKVRDLMDGYRPTGAILAYAENIGETLAEVDGDNFDEAYCGEYDSEEQYAEELFDECYEVPEHLANYIDYEKFSRDLFMGDNWSADSGSGVYVFRNI